MRKDPDCTAVQPFHFMSSLAFVCAPIILYLRFTSHLYREGVQLYLVVFFMTAPGTSTSGNRNRSQQVVGL